ncbi:MAG: class I SAM-dependent methyltransferase [Arthrospira sp. SH-MAG29]|nr:class I SAM-dependent methyltransferase [Arthrospira sp. SH-MAG29]MBS0017070.1 class I SAM-dependent methyltransferase [Arthrospira sp. SH-MAG29]
MSDPLTQLTYQAFQYSKSVLSLAHKTLSNQVLEIVAPPTPERKPQPLKPEVINQIRASLEQIYQTDWQEAETGLYPASILFDTPIEDILRYYPLLWWDMLQMQERANQKRYQEFSPEIDTEGYPRYYLQNFHHQTDGYLSDWSANLYDLGVDILFNGGADAMRRRVLAPLKAVLQGFEGVSARGLRVLDVACGTGRTLKFIRATFPKASLYGVDLSAAYLRKANQLLSPIPGELPQLIQANGEALPYQDNYFHGITSVFLFHELPPVARQKVIEEAYRVLQPGGVFVICDSIQAIDSPEFKEMMENFSVMFHEPYYRHYITDDLSDRLYQVGFERISTEQHFVSKYWIAHKKHTLAGDTVK